VDNPLGNHSRLAAARPGNNQQRAVTMRDGLGLSAVQLDP
jgi:hypothetical protein